MEFKRDKKVNFFVKNNIFLILIMLFGAVLRFYQLDNLPAEMWGDVAEGYKLTQRIVEGKYFFGYIFGGDGPMASYIFAFFSYIFGLTFLTMKTVTNFIGLILIVSIYLFAKELVDKKVGLYAAFFTAVSSWAVIFSRMAKPHILVPVFTALSFFCLFKFLKSKNNTFGLLTGILLGLGMYTQSGFWGVPVVVGLIIFFKERRRLLYILIPAFLLVVPLMRDFLINSKSHLATGSFFIDKMTVGGNFLLKFKLFLINIAKNLAAFNIKGDGTFRNNPPGSPHVDFISGILFLLGIYAVFKSRREKNIILLVFLPFFVIQIPSLLDIANPLSTPNSGRTIALLPFIYTLCSVGLVYLLKVFKNWSKIFIVLPILVLVVFLNLKKVYVDYAINLPNRNTPFAKIIAGKIDELPDNTLVIVTSCCWGEWGQPEPDAIHFSLRKKREIFFSSINRNFGIGNYPYREGVQIQNGCFIVSSPATVGINKGIRGCVGPMIDEIITVNGFSVARVSRSY